MKFFMEHYDGVLLMLGAGGITILAKTIVACIYTELLHQVHHISTTKNKWMKNMISRYETTYKMNLLINDTKSFVFMQLKDVKYLGINLYNLKNTGIYGMAATAVIYAVYMINGYYDKSGAQWYVKMSVTAGAVIMAILISELFLQLKRKDMLLRQELYDHIENNLKPHLEKNKIQSESAENEKKKLEELTTQAAAAKEETAQSENGRYAEDRYKKQNENMYGNEEIELFEEMMEGIYGEEI